jgi:DNA-binding CsgD family transcriptional regulator
MLEASEAVSLVLLGDAGIGKTELLAAAVDRALGTGKLVLRAAGVEAESEMAFAGLHQLLWPVLSQVSYLPPRQAAALRCAFALSDETTPDPFLIALATLTLLAEVSTQQPVLVVVDDASWMDGESLQTLAFVVRRLYAERVTVIVASRGGESIAAFGRGQPHMVVGPLTDEAANQLLDTLPRQVQGELRDRVLTQAAGNPLALMELSASVGAEMAVATPRTDTLSPPERLEHVFAERLANLPEHTQRLLTLAAALDGSDLKAVRAAAVNMGLDPAALGAAERAGLVTISADELRFRHPLVRSGIYNSAGFDERRAAHLALAGVLDDPDRRAWHVAAVTVEPTETVAASLEATADRFRLRAGFAAAASALERAAELSPDPAERSRRLVLAAQNAYMAGRGEWVEDLATRLSARTNDPFLRAQVAVYLLGIQAPAGHGLGLSAITPAALESVMAEAPQIGVVLVIIAAGFAFLTGNRELAATAQRLVTQIPGPTEEPWRAFVLAATDPITEHRYAIKALVDGYVAQPPTDPEVAKLAGHIAWFVDQPDHAAILLNRVIDDMRTRGNIGEIGPFLALLGLTNVWRGRWLDARAVAADLVRVAADVDQPLMVALGTALDALVLALQGESTTAREQAAAAVAHTEAGLVVAIATWALGLADLADGRYDQAHTNLALMLAPASEPAHWAIPPWALADYIEAASYVGATDGLDSIVDAALADAEAGVSVRARLVARRAKALLTSGTSRGSLFELAVATEGAEEWPFELARTRLAYGEWLRRNRQVVSARAELAAAVEVFSQLGAGSWAERARGELRAAGVRLEARSPAALQELTPQEHQIAQLAARGFTNREIGAKLFLSPRTVGFHLYHVFPKLQVTSRAQLAAIFGEMAIPVHPSTSS